MAAAAAAASGPGCSSAAGAAGVSEWLVLRDGCMRCDADGLHSLSYHPALNAILAVTSRGTIKVIDGTSGATLQASALSGEGAARRAGAGAAAGAAGGAEGLGPEGQAGPEAPGGVDARCSREGEAGELGSGGSCLLGLERPVWRGPQGEVRRARSSAAEKARPPGRARGRSCALLERSAEGCRGGDPGGRG